MARIPKYAQAIDPSLLVQYLCKGRCGCGRWLKLNKPAHSMDDVHSAEFGEFTATCLICGRVQKDHYNWYR